MPRVSLVFHEALEMVSDINLKCKRTVSFPILLGRFKLVSERDFSGLLIFFISPSFNNYLFVVSKEQS
jgi:hypothetical protein